MRSHHVKCRDRPGSDACFAWPVSQSTSQGKEYWQIIEWHW